MEKEPLVTTIYRTLVRETLFPLGLMFLTVNCAVTIPYLVVHKNSALGALDQEGIQRVVTDAWGSVNWKDWEVWTLVVVVALWATLSLLLPGQEYHGPPTLSGFRPVYYRSGFYFYLISMLVVVPLIWHFHLLHWYYKFVTFAGVLAATGLFVCVVLFVKGHLWPSPGVFGSSGSPVFDFYWGIELYPRFGLDDSLDLKTLVNSRFGLFLWQVVVLAAWKANYELHLASYARGDISWAITASTVLQTVYLAKFYFWEDGYMSTIDIAVDKFGFYVGWGCIAWVPTFYPLASLYLVKHSPNGFGVVHFAIVVTVGLAMIGMNYMSDRQRQVFRQKNGKCDIWGKPAKVIHAIYEDEMGQPKRSTLLASGYWGLARHFNYVFELGSALAWSICGGFGSIIPFLYFLFLLVLLVHRSFRDEEKCSTKYGKYWEQYCTAVPYRILPYVF